jgi:hypothetical protein
MSSSSSSSSPSSVPMNMHSVRAVGIRGHYVFYSEEVGFTGYDPCLQIHWHEMPFPMRQRIQRVMPRVKEDYSCISTVMAALTLFQLNLLLHDSVSGETVVVNSVHPDSYTAEVIAEGEDLDFWKARVITAAQAQGIRTVKESVATKIMKKMGWQGGGLGKNEQGRPDPIEAKGQNDKSGVGYSSSSSSTDEIPKSSEPKSQSFFSKLLAGESVLSFGPHLFAVQTIAPAIFSPFMAQFAVGVAMGACFLTIFVRSFVVPRVRQYMWDQAVGAAKDVPAMAKEALKHAIHSLNTMEVLAIVTGLGALVAAVAMLIVKAIMQQRQTRRKSEVSRETFLRNLRTGALTREFDDLEWAMRNLAALFGVAGSALVGWHAALRAYGGISAGIGMALGSCKAGLMLANFFGADLSVVTDDLQRVDEFLSSKLQKEGVEPPPDVQAEEILDQGVTLGDRSMVQSLIDGLKNHKKKVAATGVVIILTLLMVIVLMRRKRQSMCREAGIKTATVWRNAALDQWYIVFASDDDDIAFRIFSREDLPEAFALVMGPEDKLDQVPSYIKEKASIIVSPKQVIAGTRREKGGKKRGKIVKFVRKGRNKTDWVTYDDHGKVTTFEDGDVPWFEDRSDYDDYRVDYSMSRYGASFNFNGSDPDAPLLMGNDPMKDKSTKQFVDDYLGINEAEGVSSFNSKGQRVHYEDGDEPVRDAKVQPLVPVSKAETKLEELVVALQAQLAAQVAVKQEPMVKSKVNAVKKGGKVCRAPGCDNNHEWGKCSIWKPKCFDTKCDGECGKYHAPKKPLGVKQLPRSKATGREMMVDRVGVTDAAQKRVGIFRVGFRDGTIQEVNCIPLGGYWWAAYHVLVQGSGDARVPLPDTGRLSTEIMSVAMEIQKDGKTVEYEVDRKTIYRAKVNGDWEDLVTFMVPQHATAWFMIGTQPKVGAVISVVRPKGVYPGAVSAILEKELQYTCPTDDGFCTAPVLDEYGKIVALHLIGAQANGLPANRGRLITADFVQSVVGRQKNL